MKRLAPPARRASAAARRRTGGDEIVPVPGIVLPPDLDSDNGWEVRDGAPGTDVRRRRMSVPTAPTETNRQLQLHELAHAKWTPAVDAAAVADALGVSEDLLQAVEDARLAGHLAAARLPQNKACYGAEDLSALATCTPLQGVVAAAATVGTGDSRNVRKTLRKRFGRRWENDVYGTLRNVCGVLAGGDYSASQLARVNPRQFAAHASFDDTCATARALASLAADRAETEEATERAAGAPGDGEPEAAETLAGIDGIREADPDAAAREADPARCRAGLSPGRNLGEGTGSAWEGITLRHHRYPLTVPMRVGLRGRRRIATDAGAVPRQMHRLTIDGRVFGGRAIRRHGGAVLIDRSGSMSLSGAQVDAMMEALPAAIIATYSGNGSSGVLRIIAAEGRRVDLATLDNDYPHLGGNVVDGPALVWLTKQKGPRFWICDGIVTTHDDRATTTGAQECAVLCLKHRVLRLDTAEDLAEWAKKHRG